MTLIKSAYRESSWPRRLLRSRKAKRRRDDATIHDATKIVHVINSRFKMVAADVVEVHVDIVRCEFAKFSGEIVGCLVIDHRVDVSFLYEPLNFVDLSIAANDLAIGMTTYHFYV